MNKLLPMLTLKEKLIIIGGSIVGIFALPLLLIGYNYFFINKNDAEKHLDKYIQNSKEILITVPNYDPHNDFNARAYSRQSTTTSMQTKNMGRDGSQKISMLYRIVFDQPRKKYFKIVMIDGDNDFWFAISNNTIYAMVNQEDLENPKLGTKENPVLIFSARGANKPLMGMDSYWNPVPQDTSREQYAYNILMYLTYIMPKEEFERRFKNE